MGAVFRVSGAVHEIVPEVFEGGLADYHVFGAAAVLVHDLAAEFPAFSVHDDIFAGGGGLVYVAFYELESESCGYLYVID